AEDGIRDRNVTGVQTCALPISAREPWSAAADAMLIMTPLSASRKTDKALRVDLIIDLVLIAKTLSHNSSVMSAAGVILSIMPALFTKISSFPYVLTA